MGVLLLLLLVGIVWLLIRSSKLSSALKQKIQQEQTIRAELNAEREGLNKTHEAALVELNAERDELNKAHQTAMQQIASEREAIDRDRENANKEISDKQRLSKQLSKVVKDLQHQLETLEQEKDLQIFEFYEFTYRFENADGYKARINTIKERQKQLHKDKKDAICKTEWTVGGSKKDGAKFIKNLLTLLLKSFNGECDAIISDVRYDNIAKYRDKIQKLYTNLNTLVVSHGCEITHELLALRIEELELVYEYQQKREAEREEQRLIKEQMREEEKAQREAEKLQRQAEEQEKQYAQALERARQEMAIAKGSEVDALTEKLRMLEEKLSSAKLAKERAVSQAQLTKSGHVYVISNIGSFGEHVYKIGMTRRLEPMDRVKELGDASVPFDFDVHAIIYCDDAPALENVLHRALHPHRVNKVNEKKEFFRIDLTTIEKIAHQNNCQVEFTKLAEAREYRETLSRLTSDSGVTNVHSVRVS